MSTRGIALAAVIIIALAAVASVALMKKETPPAAKPVAAASAAKTHLDKLTWLAEPQAAPDTPFTDADGNPHTLADFKGKALVVNFWATWCGPCVEEMPTLDALQATLGSDKFAVITISQDREGAKVAQPFAATHDWKNLALYVEPAGHFARDAKLAGLPTSILINRDGQEVAKLEGANDWNAPDVRAVIQERLLAQP